MPQIDVSSYGPTDAVYRLALDLFERLDTLNHRLQLIAESLDAIEHRLGSATVLEMQD